MNTLTSRFRWQHDALQLPWQAQLCQSFGWHAQNGERLPSLAQHRGEPTLVHADPIHLQADRDTATFIGPNALSLGAATADTLIQSLNEFVEHDGLQFHRLDPDAWFMSGLSTDALAAYPTSFLSHRKASAFMPKGDGSAQWQRLMTEIQMLLHMHPVNREREQSGLPVVNSVWFWGGAPLPVMPVPAEQICVYADDQHAIALCEQFGIDRFPLEDLAPQESDWMTDKLSSEPAREKHVIVVDTRLINAMSGVFDGEFEKLEQQLHDQYLLPLSDLVRRGSLSELRLLSEDGLYGVCTGSRNWWQRLLGRRT